MQPYIIQQGDYLTKLASRRGFDEDKVWNDPKNEALRKTRKDPNQLVTGDVLYVPERKPVWTPIKIGQVNTFVADVKRTKVKLRFVSKGKPLSNEPYTLDGGLPKEGKTDGDGVVEADVLVTTSTVRVHFAGRREVFTAHIGHLDPVDEATGAHQRLVALGAFGRPQGGALGPGFSKESLAQALVAFQRANALPATGTLDDATRGKLVELHGS